MSKSIRSVAVYFAAMIFFIMSLTGWFCGQSPATCCNRAILGAIVTYIAVSIAAKAIAKVIMDAMIESKMNQFKNTED
jgi:hypothetical protein